MLEKTIQQLKIISHSRQYWWFYIVAGFILMAVALYHQHVLELLPCLMCIQVRLLLSVLLIVSISGVLFKNIRRLNSTLHIATVFIAAGLAERSYMLLGTERGFVFSDCGFELGLPAWFAIEQWLPWIYRVETTCGYTPELLFNITMAEALMMMSTVFLPVSFCVALASFLRIDAGK